jgi:ABC-type phosphate transport system ATPase subunit
MVRIFLSKMPYGYEYIGTQERIVITPLTERCWFTIADCIYRKDISLIIGPSGSGKTETIREMGRLVAKNYLTFACSENMSHKVI